MSISNVTSNGRCSLLTSSSAFCSCLQAVKVTNDRIAQQQQERMAEAQAQLQQMLLTQHAAAAKGLSNQHTATSTSSGTMTAAAAARAGGTASPEAGQQRRQDPKEGWLRGITLSQCQPGSSFT